MKPGVLRSLTFCFIICVPVLGYAADTLSLQEALAKKRIALAAVGNGGLQGKPLSVELVNNVSAPLVIKLSSGLRFISEDAEAQDLILLEEGMIALEGKGTVKTHLFAACTQMSNHSPKENERYGLGAMAEGSLLEIAELVDGNQFFNTTAQAAVWGMTDAYETNSIHGSDDVNLTWDLVRIVALAQRAQVPEREEFVQRPVVRRVLYSSRADLVFHAPREVNAKLELYTESGVLVRTYFPEKALHSGLHIFTVGLNNILDEEENFVAKLVDQTGTALVAQPLINNMPYQEVVQQTTPVDFEYIVRKTSLVTLAVYDTNDNLIQEIFSNRKLGLSKRRANFKFYHNITESEVFKVKVTNNDNEVLHEQIVKI